MMYIDDALEATVIFIDVEMITLDETYRSSKEEYQVSNL